MTSCFVCASLNLGRKKSTGTEPFVGFFNVPLQPLTRGKPLYGYSKKPPHFSPILRRSLEYGGPILVLDPRVPDVGGGGFSKKMRIIVLEFYASEASKNVLF